MTVAFCFFGPLTTGRSTGGLQEDDNVIGSIRLLTHRASVCTSDEPCGLYAVP